jgi:hypothetical protein
MLLLAIAGMLAGCDLVTEENPASASRPANHIVINEVFTLPSTTDQYSWIELYNPTGERVGGLQRWSLTFTYHFSGRGIDTTIPVTAHLGGPFLAVPDTLEPGRFLVLFSDSIRFYNHTNLGPGKGTATAFFAWGGGGQNFGGFAFALSETDEIVLSDTSGTPVDIVRYGNYVPPVPDPYPANRSAGMIPVWSSLCRYAGAYSTGNTSDDFYMDPKPVPRWTSQLSHP